jgi:hypothetical protein
LCAHARVTRNRARGDKPQVRLHCMKPYGILNQDSITGKISSHCPIFLIWMIHTTSALCLKCSTSPCYHREARTPRWHLFPLPPGMCIPSRSSGYPLPGRYAVMDDTPFSAFIFEAFSPPIASSRFRIVLQTLLLLSLVPAHARLYCPCSQSRQIQKKVYKPKDPRAAHESQCLQFV